MKPEQVPQPNIVLCGQASIIASGERPHDAVRISGRRAQVVAARLVMERGRGGLTRDQLAETVWGERLPVTWPSALRGLVSKVRKALGVLDDAADLTFDGTRYTLWLAESVTVDVEEALRVLAVPCPTAEAPSRGRDPRAPLSERTAWALETLSRPFLPDVDGEWARSAREHIEHQRVEGLHSASQRAHHAGHAAVAVELARQAAALSPFSDRTMRLYLRVLIETGRRDRAISEFMQFQRRLNDELGVSAEQATQDVYLTALGEVTEPPPPLPRTTALPDTYYGMDDVLTTTRELWDLTTRGRGGHLRVTGEHGAGKSAFVRAVLQALGGSCDNLIVCEPWQRSGGGSALVHALASRAQARPSADSGERGSLPAGPERWAMDQLAETASQPTLLLIDDVDQADETTRRVLEVLMASRRWPEKLMVVSTAALERPLPPDPLWSQLPMSSPWSRDLELQPWGVRELRRLVEDQLGTATSATNLFVVRERSGGNPFLAKLLMTAHGEPEARSIASTHLQRRCTDLGRDSIDLLKAIALAAPVIEHDVLAGMLGRPPADIHALLADLIRLHLVQEVRLPASARSHTGIRFVHGIDHEVIVDHLGPSERERLHRGFTQAVLHQGLGTPSLYLGIILDELPAGHLRECPETCPAAIVDCIRSVVSESEVSEAIRLLQSVVEALPHLDDAASLALKIDLAHLLLETEDKRATVLLLDTAGRAISSGDLPRAMEASQILEECYRRWPDHFPVPGPVLNIVSQRLRTDWSDVDCFHAARFTASVLRHGDPDVPEYAIDAAVVVLTEKLEQQSQSPLAAPYRADIAEDLWTVASAKGDWNAAGLALRHGLAAGCIVNDREIVHRFETRLRGEHRDSEWARRVSLQRRSVLRFCQGAWTHDRDGAVSARQDLIATWALSAPRPRADATAPAYRRLPAADAPLAAHLLGHAAGARQQLRFLVATLPEAISDASFHDIGALSLASAEMEDRDTMDMLMELMAPFVDLSCGQGFQTSVGPVALHLGRMARRLGRTGIAGEYLDRACSIASRMQQPVWVGHGLQEHAELLDASGSRGAEAAATELRREADRLLGQRVPASALPR